MASNKRIFFVFYAAIFFIPTDSANITYKGIGTFTTDDFHHPIYRPIVLLPKSPEEIDATFSLFTRNNRDQADVLAYNATIEQLRSTRFDPKLETKLIVHGFQENARKWMQEMKDNFLQAQDLNVIVIEWPKGENPPYSQAVANAKVMGPMVGIFIKNLVQAYNVSLDSIHLIGHSLGAHVAGFAGKYLKGRLFRITGLDPAGPYFEGLNQTEARLWHTDAKFVDSIHTDSSHPSIPYSGFGMYETCSHVDIYPNGGLSQPGCLKQRLTAVALEGLKEGTRRILLCSHIRSVDYFTEAILPTIAQPVAYQCDDYEQFQQGNCASCGQDNSRCVIMAPLSHPIGFGKNVAPGKRYFMSTAKSAKYFRFQCLISIQMAHTKTKDREMTADVRISLKLIQNDNKTETIEFNDKKQQFQYGNNYSRVFVSDLDPEQIVEIEFILKKGAGVLSGLLREASIRVDHLQIIALSTKSKQQPESNKPEPPKKIKFVLDRDEPDEISTDRKKKKGAIFKRVAATNFTNERAQVTGTPINQTKIG